MKSTSTTTSPLAQPRGLNFAQLRGLKKALILSGVAAIALSSPAYAGFQWKGPIAPPPVAAPAAPASDADISALAPVTSPNGQTTLAPQAAPVAAAPVAATPAPVAPAPAATPVAAPADAADVVNGFGSGVPLVMALQQIVPPGYQYSFSSGVNPGVSVSWQGGRAWQTVLTDMLSTQNLGYRVQNNVVVVGDFPPPAVQAAPQAAPAVQPAVMAPETKAAQIPVDMLGEKAAAPAAAAPAQTPVDIRRQRPDKHKRTFWERLTGTGDDAENDVYTTPAANTAVPSASSSAAPASAPATNSADVRAMNAARAMTDTANVTAQNDLTVPPASVAHPAGASMADQAMAGAAVKSQVPDSSDWGTPSSVATTADVPSATASASVPVPMPAVAPAPVAVAPVAPVSAEDNHAVSLTQTSPAPEAAPVVASVAVPAAPAVAPAPVKGDWIAHKGDTLRDVLKDWSDKAGVQLYWSIDYNYRINGNLDYTGGYDDAVAKLLDQFATVRPQPYGQLHQGSDGPRVLVVKSYDISR